MNDPNVEYAIKAFRANRDGSKESMILACAYAEEHPADDDEPMTCQWLVDAGFVERSHRCFDFGDITLSQNVRNGIPVEWVLYLRGFEARMSKCPRTRGDVRRLCAALGLPLDK